MNAIFEEAWAAMAACLREIFTAGSPRTSARWNAGAPNLPQWGKPWEAARDGCFSSGQTAATGS